MVLVLLCHTLVVSYRSSVHSIEAGVIFDTLRENARIYEQSSSVMSTQILTGDPSATLFLPGFSDVPSNLTY
jgi:hypothetical protein